MVSLSSEYEFPVSENWLCIGLLVGGKDASSSERIKELLLESFIHSKVSFRNHLKDIGRGGNQKEEKKTKCSKTTGGKLSDTELQKTDSSMRIAFQIAYYSVQSEYYTKVKTIWLQNIHSSSLLVLKYLNNYFQQYEYFRVRNITRRGPSNG